VSLALLPPTCVLCGGAGHAGRDLCAGCAADLPANPVACPRCALPLGAPAPQCGACLKRPPAFLAALAPFRYADPLDGLVQRYKFGADLAAGRVLAQLLGDALDGALAPDLLVPVPLHRTRLRERGFNQALDLGRLLARRFALVLAPRVLARTRATPAQSGLDARTRRRNVRRAFVASTDVRGKHVALLDDVVTTGATVRECAKALRRAGAASVVVWAVARSPARR
jgi:ComF family protein